MNLAKMFADGQVKIPVGIRMKLNLNDGDKVLFIERSTGEVEIRNASITNIPRVQESSLSTTKELGVEIEAKIQHLIDESRYNHTDSA